MAVTAIVSLKRDDLPAIGRDRLRLLEAVGREGSISAGARAVGLTYRAGWDALETMRSVFSAPLVETRIGGRDRGGATLTPLGRRVIAAFYRLEAEMERLSQAFDAELAGAAPSRGRASASLARTSARNALPGAIAAMRARALTSLIEIEVSRAVTVSAEVTSRSVEELGLHVGREVLALIKAPFVTIAPEKSEAGPCNRLPGVVRRFAASGGQAELILDVDRDTSIAALMRADAIDAARLPEGAPAFASFDPAHVVLAIH